MEFEFDSPDLRHFSQALEAMASRGVPFAVRNTLNRSAFKAREVWQGEIRKAFTLRNTFTVRSIRVEKARGGNPLGMVAKVGSVAPYMAEQEQGATVRKSGSRGVPIASSVASGEGRGARPRKRVVRRPNRLPNIRLAPRLSTMSRRQRALVAVKMAVAAGRKFVFLELERGQGIYRIRGRRRPKLDLVWDLSRPSIRIPASKTLARSLRRVERDLPDIAKGALLEQLRRWRVVGF